MIAFSTTAATQEIARQEEASKWQVLEAYFEKLIQLAKESGQSTLDTYEKSLQSMLDFEKSLASRSQLVWVTALANTHAKFVQDLTGFYIKAARDALK